MTEPNASASSLPTTTHRYFLIAVALYLLTAVGNITLSINNPEEARYAVAARQMMRDGDWLVPKFNGELRLVKPILIYWIYAGCGKVGTALGLNLTMAMRFGPLFMGLLAVIATFLITLKLTRGNARAAMVSAVVLMTCYEFHNLCSELIIEMALTAFLTWSWYFVLVSLERIAARADQSGDGPATFPALLGFYVSLGLACMTKGPLPVAGFLVLPLIVYLIMTRQLPRLKSAGLWWGVPLTCAIGFWWFFALAQLGHKEGANIFFMRENLDRVMGAKDHIHPWPWIYYFTLWPLSFAPWTLAVPFAFYWLIKKRQSGRPWFSCDSSRLIFCSGVVAFLIIGLSASKRTLYALPLFPSFALWMGWIFNDVFVTNDSQESSQTTPLRSFKYAGAALAAAVIIVLAYDLTFVRKRDKSLGNEAFYAAIAKHLNGRSLVTLNESANEAVWYLDLGKPITKLNYKTLKERFFESSDTILLLKDKDLVKTPELKPALHFVDGFEKKHGKDTYYLATPEPGRKPDEKIFEGRTKEKDTSKDTGDE